MANYSMNTANKNSSIIKTIFNREFVTSAVIPVIIFLVFGKLNMTLDGIILSGVWSIGVVVFNFIKEHKINALATMAGALSAIGLIGTVISKNPTFYLIVPIAQDILIAIVFFGSLFFKKSLIQIIVEQTYLRNVPEEFKAKPKYRSAWRILTFTWGILNISQAVVRIILLHSVSMGSYYALSTLYSNISTPLLIAISIAFPKWYWTKGKNTKTVQ